MYPPPQLWLLVVFAILGVVAGVLQMREDRTCPYCRLQAPRTAARCPHCLCRLD